MALDLTEVLNFVLQFTMYEEGKSKVMFFFWLHSAFFTLPPPDMGGAARSLTDDECAEVGLTPGAWSLILSKHEIDRASKDTRCAHFDPDFRVELFFTPLLGESGTGLGLDAMRAQALAVVRTEAQSEVVEQPLQVDREAYQRYGQATSRTGRPQLSFQAWLLGADPGPISGDAAAPNSVAAASNSDLVFDR
jgi:hypothetical protein